MTNLFPPILECHRLRSAHSHLGTSRSKVQFGTAGLTQVFRMPPPPFGALPMGYVAMFSRSERLAFALVLTDSGDLECLPLRLALSRLGAFRNTRRRTQADTDAFRLQDAVPTSGPAASWIVAVPVPPSASGRGAASVPGCAARVRANRASHPDRPVRAARLDEAEHHRGGPELGRYTQAGHAARLRRQRRLSGELSAPPAHSRS